jgi:ArsR family transcriptional regulator, arsenate/arsenite/antimonite-responsive transcriptional repressor
MKKNTDINYEHDSEILKALGHPVRLKIVAGLLQNECSVNSMVEKLQLPQSTVSQHLGILRNKGIIIPKKDGVITCYHVADKRVIKIIQILSQ